MFAMDSESASYRVPSGEATRTSIIRDQHPSKQTKRALRDTTGPRTTKNWINHAFAPKHMQEQKSGRKSSTSGGASDSEVEQFLP